MKTNSAARVLKATGQILKFVEYRGNMTPVVESINNIVTNAANNHELVAALEAIAVGTSTESYEVQRNADNIRGLIVELNNIAQTALRNTKGTL